MAANDPREKSREIENDRTGSQDQDRKTRPDKKTGSDKPEKDAPYRYTDWASI